MWSSLSRLGRTTPSNELFSVFKRPAKRPHAMAPTGCPRKLAWGKGYVVTTDLDLLDEFVVKLLRNEGMRNDRPSRTG